MSRLWPGNHGRQYEESYLVEDTIELPVQIKGKLKARIQVPSGLDKDATQAAAEAHADVQKLLEGRTILKVIAVPGRMVNFVVK